MEFELIKKIAQDLYQAEMTHGRIEKLTVAYPDITVDDAYRIQLEVNKLKEALKGTDSAAIKSATEELQKAFYAVSEKLYKQAAPQGDPGQYQQPGGPQGGQQSGPQGNYYDADYEVVDDDNNK